MRRDVNIIFISSAPSVWSCYWSAELWPWRRTEGCDWWRHQGCHSPSHSAWSSECLQLLVRISMREALSHDHRWGETRQRINKRINKNSMWWSQFLFPVWPVITWSLVFLCELTFTQVTPELNLATPAASHGQQVFLTKLIEVKAQVFADRGQVCAGTPAEAYTCRTNRLSMSNCDHVGWSVA